MVGEVGTFLHFSIHNRNAVLWTPYREQGTGTLAECVGGPRTRGALHAACGGGKHRQQPGPRGLQGVGDERRGAAWFHRRGEHGA